MRGGYLEPFVLLEPPAHNTGCCVIGLTYSSGTFVSFFVFTAGCKASGPPGPPLHPPWNPWNIQLSQGTGQGVSMTFNAASRLRSLEDRSAALGSSRCELPGMHSVPKSAVLPYASGVGGLSRRLLNIYIYTHIYVIYIYIFIFIFIYLFIYLFSLRPEAGSPSCQTQSRQHQESLTPRAELSR